MSFTKTHLLAALAAAPALVAAHGHVVSVAVNGEVFPGFQPGNPNNADSVGWSTTVTDNGFVLSDSLASDDIVCHRGATNAAKSATVAAGDALSITWDTWPTSHVGPIIDYLASCNGDCTSVDKTALQFFKINEGGLLDGSNAPGRWVTDELIENGLTWTTTIPADIAPGSYVLRHEIIALHEGNRQNGAQMYPQCINLEITGSGSSAPAGVAATSLYTASDAGILFNVYQANSDYPIPGPALASGGGNGGAAPPANPPATPPAASSAAPSAVPTTLATTTGSPAAPTQPPANGGGNNSQAAALYGQCGGEGFAGGKCCSTGACKSVNKWYSQCLN
jgi:cellulase